MTNRLEERPLNLTEEEALNLLELAMSCPVDYNFEQRAALVKLSEFCRQFMRSETSSHQNGAKSSTPKPGYEELSVSPAVAA